ncbi:hypothetical protein [Chitinophaga nivalis]|uniref:Uncharacterized protein n=1 Tax=Chitinophaga nivalis TaxID=2991709 RepID=A0ABT3ILV0_9BACT|nr:hypothetical protein [Chitinophaga nivalis]MCW3465371.1 hypothetical protein [Chitinophaga nivalis]MCW3484937.1 hypothetical protein [Chitinophaga nivalis]
MKKPTNEGLKVQLQTFTYKNGQVAIVKHYGTETDPEIKAYDSLEYQQGRLARSYHSGPGYQYNEERIYNWKDGNLISVQQSYLNNNKYVLSSTRAYTYGTRPNPFKNMIWVLVLLQRGGDAELLSNNNPIKRTYILANGETTYSTSEMSYNGIQVPVGVTTTYVSSSGTTQQTGSYEFIHLKK